MIDNIDEISLANDLIKLSGHSLSYVARNALLSPGNLSNWVKGTRKALGEENKSRLFFTLGIVEGKLDPQKVHRWTLKKASLDPLYHVMNVVGKSSVELFYLAPKKLNNRDYLPDRFYCPILIHGNGLRILLFRKIYSFEKYVPLIDPSFLPEKSQWRILPKDSYFDGNVQRIENIVFDHLYNQEVTIEEFDRIVQGTPEESHQAQMTIWEDVAKEFEMLGFSPETALEWIQKNHPNKKQDKGKIGHDRKSKP